MFIINDVEIKGNRVSGVEKIDNLISKNNKKIIILGLIGVVIIGSVFHYFSSLNTKDVDSIGMFNFFNLNFLFASLLFISTLIFLALRRLMWVT
jgi:hypothetical protein